VLAVHEHNRVDVPHPVIDSQSRFEASTARQAGLFKDIQCVLINRTAKQLPCVLLSSFRGFV
jgi:hypothetical protein